MNPLIHKASHPRGSNQQLRGSGVEAEGRQTRGLQQPPSTRRSPRGVWAPLGWAGGWGLGPGACNRRLAARSGKRRPMVETALTPPRAPYPTPAPLCSASRGQKGRFSRLREPRPARDWAAAASRPEGRCPSSPGSWAAPARSSAASPWPGCSLCSCSCSPNQVDGNGGAGVMVLAGDPRILEDAAGARAPVRLAPAGDPRGETWMKREFHQKESGNTPHPDAQRGIFPVLSPPAGAAPAAPSPAGC